MKKDDLKAIFIVAGHGKSPTGKRDVGAVGENSNERAEVVEISKDTIAFLKAQDDLTHCAIYDIGVNEELTLSEKISQVNQICKENKYDGTNSILVSVHVNAGGGTGVEAWYFGNCKISMSLGTAISKEMSEITGLKSRGAKSEFLNRWGSLGIIHKTKPLAVLVECGFIDNVWDVRVLSDPELDDGFGKGIAKGLMTFIGGLFKVQLPDVKPLKDKPFLDVPKDAWYSEDIKLLKDEKIMRGFKDGTFKPSGKVTRAELAVVTARVIRHLEMKISESIEKKKLLNF